MVIKGHKYDETDMVSQQNLLQKYLRHLLLVVFVYNVFILYFTVAATIIFICNKCSLHSYAKERAFGIRYK